MNNGYLTWRPRYILYRISRFAEKFVICEVMWKNFVEPGRAQMTIWYMHIACWIPKATKHTLRMWNTYFFFSSTVVAWTHLSVPLYKHCLSFQICLTILHAYKHLHWKFSCKRKLLFCDQGKKYMTESSVTNKYATVDGWWWIHFCCPRDASTKDIMRHW
jgi:hypothetical protein